MSRGYSFLPSQFYEALASYVVERRPTYSVEDVSFVLWCVDLDCDGDDMAPCALEHLKCRASWAMKRVDDGEYPGRRHTEQLWDLACQAAWLEGRRGQRALADGIWAATGIRVR